jgi:hypothetical protein
MASPSIRALSTGRAPTASAILGNLSLNRAPRRLHTSTRSPCFRVRIRNPSCLTSCSQPARREVTAHHVAGGDKGDINEHLAPLWENMRRLWRADVEKIISLAKSDETRETK